MLRKRWVGKQHSASMGVGLVTIFVDDIPEKMDPKGLFTLFNKFRVIKDVFIPMRRRKSDNVKIQVCSVNCSIAASIAIQKADGIWCDDKRLKLKYAEEVQ